MIPPWLGVRFCRLLDGRFLHSVRTNTLQKRLTDGGMVSLSIRSNLWRNDVVTELMHHSGTIPVLGGHGEGLIGRREVRYMKKYDYA